MNLHEHVRRRSVPQDDRKSQFPTFMRRAMLLAVVVLIPAIALPSVASARPRRALTVKLTAYPAASTTSTNASFSWTTSAAVTAATCSLDGASAPCTSPRAYSGLAVGSHTFALTVSNSSGFASTSYSWSVTAAAPPPPPAPAPPPSGGNVLWTGDLEEGSLMDWYAPSQSATGDYGGGEYNSGSGDTVVSNTVAHNGSVSQKMTLSTGVGGTRMFRWRELRNNRTTRQSTWMYIPRNYTLTADPATGKYWILYEFKSRLADNSRNDPFWYVNAYNRSDGTMGARLAWGYQSQLEGPRLGERGWRNFGDVTIPVGRWFQISSTITQSKDFDGALDVTVDGQSLASLRDIRTGFANCTYNAWCVEQHWAVTNYSDGIAQTPSDIYTDDAQIDLPS